MPDLTLAEEQSGHHLMHNSILHCQQISADELMSYVSTASEEPH